MLEIKVITVKKAKADIQDAKTKSRKSRRKSPIIEEYEGYLNKLERRKAIEFTLKEGDKYQTIKYRLNNAAKSLGIKNLKIERAGNKVIFYKEVRPRTRKIVPHKAEVSPPQDETQQEQYLYEFEYQPELETGTRPPDADAIQSTFAPASTQDLAHTPIPTPTPGQEAELLTFDFDEEWEVPMVHGYKTCEARIEKYAGDSFEAFGHQFVITKVEKLALGHISQKWFKQHGLFSPREFQEVWKAGHNGVFDLEQEVWLYHFSRGFEPPIEAPIELDSDVSPESEVQD